METDVDCCFFIYSGQFPSKWETDFILYGSSLSDTSDMFSCGNVFARPLSEVKSPYMSDYLKTCDAKKILEQCEQLERKKKPDTDSYYALVQDLISAYLVNGDFASARKWLAYMESKQKLAGKYKENVKNLGVLCAVMENDYPRAARLIEDMRDMVRKKPKNKHLRQKLANAVLVLDARTGEQKVAKEYYEKLFAKGTRNLSEKIWCKYHLLAAYELEQNEDKIKECLVYLDQHGNNTYMAKIAREKRKSMDI